MVAAMTTGGTMSVMHAGEFSAVHPFPVTILPAELL